MKKLMLTLGLVAFLAAGTVYSFSSLETTTGIEASVGGEGDKAKKKKETTSKAKKSDAKSTKTESSKKNKKDCSHKCTGKTKVS